MTDVGELSLPIDASSRYKNNKRASHMVKPHIISNSLPRGSSVYVDDNIFVASPELCFLQLATSMSLYKLIELGLELCGNYSLPGFPSEHDVINYDSMSLTKRPALTSVKKLSAFLSRAKGFKGHRQAMRALQYIIDGSASPRETVLLMLLTLPYKLGGYGLPTPKLNARIDIERPVYEGGRRTYYCDLYWPRQKVAVEYDSDLYHTGAERIAYDSIRRSDLTILGIEVVTVSNQQLKNIIDLEHIAKLLSARVGKNLRLDRVSHFRDKQREMRKALFSST